MLLCIPHDFWTLRPIICRTLYASRRGTRTRPIMVRPWFEYLSWQSMLLVHLEPLGLAPHTPTRQDETRSVLRVIAASPRHS